MHTCANMFLLKDKRMCNWIQELSFQESKKNDWKRKGKRIIFGKKNKKSIDFSFIFFKKKQKIIKITHFFENVISEYKKNLI